MKCRCVLQFLRVDKSKFLEGSRILQKIVTQNDFYRSEDNLRLQIVDACSS